MKWYLDFSRDLTEDEWDAMTDDQVMERINTASEIKRRRENVMDYAIANRCIVDALAGENHRENKQMEMVAFMATFHPDVPFEDAIDMAREAYQ